MRPVCHSEAPILEAHDLLGGLVLPDRRKQLPERSPLLLLRLAAQLRWCVVGDFDDDGVVVDGSGDGDVGVGSSGYDAGRVGQRRSTRRNSLKWKRQPLRVKGDRTYPSIRTLPYPVISTLTPGIPGTAYNHT